MLAKSDLPIEDVIPQIVRVILEKRPADAVPYVFPHVCPVCGSAATREINEKTGKDSKVPILGDLPLLGLLFRLFWLVVRIRKVAP